MWPSPRLPVRSSQAKEGGGGVGERVALRETDEGDFKNAFR